MQAFFHLLFRFKMFRSSGTIVSDVPYAKWLHILFEPFVPEVRQTQYEQFKGSGSEDGAAPRV
jgi:hypothetical protein